MSGTKSKSNGKHKASSDDEEESTSFFASFAFGNLDQGGELDVEDEVSVQQHAKNNK